MTTLEQKFSDAVTSPIGYPDLMAKLAAIAESHFAQQPAAKPDGLTVDKQNCGNCRFYRDQLCKRLPPQNVLWASDNQHPIAYETVSGFPHIAPDGWCGEWSVLTGEAAVTAGNPLSEALLPCPICGGREGCDHSLSERMRAKLIELNGPEKQAGAEVEFDEASGLNFDQRCVVERKFSELAQPGSRPPLTDISVALVEWALSTFKPSQPEKVMPSDEAIAEFIEDYTNIDKSSPRYLLAALAHFAPPNDAERERLRQDVIDAVRACCLSGDEAEIENDLVPEVFAKMSALTAYETAHGEKG